MFREFYISEQQLKDENLAIRIFKITSGLAHLIKN